VKLISSFGGGAVAPADARGRYVATLSGVAESKHRDGSELVSPAGEATIQPRDYRVFAGVTYKHQWPLRSPWFYHALGGRLGDNRDWMDVDAWARGIGGALRAAPK
jgi:hypothetical protein